VKGDSGKTVGPGSDRALRAFLKALAVGNELRPSLATPLTDQRPSFDPAERQHRQVQELVQHTQRLLQLSEGVRDAFFWHKVKAASTNDWITAIQEFKNDFWDNVIGRFPKANLPANPQTRKILEKAGWTGYEVVLDVWP